MNYIADTLGVDVNTELWNGVGGLPYYLVDRYEFMKATIDGVPCLIMKPRGEPDTLTAIKKHISKVREVEPLPIVLDIVGITARRRQSLIDARIPFVATARQIYLPFLGIALYERYVSIKAPRETLMPSSQLLLFHYLYQNKDELCAGETANLFGISAMQISRAIKQLTALNIVLAKKDGVRAIIYSEDKRSDMFENAKPFLLNPVRRKIYVECTELPTGLPLSSYSALSVLSMLGIPAIETYAFFGKVGELNGIDALVDNTKQAEIEIWRYDPMLLSKHPGVVDTLSLVASLLPGDDERVEQAIDGLLSDLWR